MAASGKSSNRHYEYHRGYSGGGGHGIYAKAGAAARARIERDLALAHAAQQQTQQECGAKTSKDKTRSGEPVPSSLIVGGGLLLWVAAALAGRKAR